MKNSATFELQGTYIRSGGFRPFFWKIAAEANLTGWISNSEKGVLFCIEGTDEQISSFIRSMPATVPGAFRLTSVSLIKRKTNLPESKQNNSFRIINSEYDLPPQTIPPDRAPCIACSMETLNPSSNRFSYAFSNCALCGPGYSYALRTPFIRRNTSLTAFPVCADCKQDCENENDRHHAGSETLTCPKCGPQFFLLDMYGELVTDDNPLCIARDSIQKGEIVALQSLYGGFQLFTNAFNVDTIQRLRRKRKLPDRPLSLIARNTEVIRKYCICSEEELRLLASPAAPVMILKRKKNIADPLPQEISPDTDTLAVALPSSLPEKLIFEHIGYESPEPFDILVTCGDNRPGKAECLDIDEIFNRLMAFTDKFLCHDLNTSHPCPPSILTMCGEKPLFLRRARGYVPEEVRITKKLSRTVGAFGSDAQAAVALAFDNRIVPSQAVGSIESGTETGILDDLFERFTYLFDRVPDIMACDMDQDSYSARACADFADLHGLPLITVQSHHAHALACMAEHGLQHALAIVFNGGSAGPDGTLWGAECLEARMDGFSRFASFQPSVSDNNRPARLFLERLAEKQITASPPLLTRLGVDESEYRQWQKRLLSYNGQKQTHSALRLINTVCAGIGIAPDFCTYPDRCLLILRKYAEMYDRTQPIPEEISSIFRFELHDENRFRLIDWNPCFINLSRLDNIPEEIKPVYAAAFYQALSESILAMCLFAESESGIREIVLSGSVFSDPVLRMETEKLLTLRNFKVYTHEQLPCDESCIPAGQAYAAGLVPDDD